MWARQIIHLNTSAAIILPSDVTRSLKWQGGDMLVITVVGPNKVQLSKLNPDRDLELAQAVVDLTEEHA